MRVGFSSRGFETEELDMHCRLLGEMEEPRRAECSKDRRSQLPRSLRETHPGWGSSRSFVSKLFEVGGLEAPVIPEEVRLEGSGITWKWKRSWSVKESRLPKIHAIHFLACPNTAL